MPVLANPKHEIFASELAKGRTLEEAYALAGYAKSRSNASVLRTNQNILDRVAELQGNVAENTQVTIEGLILEANEVYRTAMKERQLGAANGALKLKAVFAGLYVEKSDNTHRYKNDAADWSREELVAFLDDARASSARVIAPPRRIDEPDQVH